MLKKIIKYVLNKKVTREELQEIGILCNGHKASARLSIVNNECILEERSFPIEEDLRKFDLIKEIRIKITSSEHISILNRRYLPTEVISYLSIKETLTYIEAYIELSSEGCFVNFKKKETISTTDILEYSPK